MESFTEAVVVLKARISPVLVTWKIAAVRKSPANARDTMKARASSYVSTTAFTDPILDAILGLKAAPSPIVG